MGSAIEGRADKHSALQVRQRGHAGERGARLQSLLD
jgi:hypothetical protein